MKNPGQKKLISIGKEQNRNEQQKKHKRTTTFFVNVSEKGKGKIDIFQIG